VEIKRSISAMQQFERRPSLSLVRKTILYRPDRHCRASWLSARCHQTLWQGILELHCRYRVHLSLRV